MNISLAASVDHSDSKFGVDCLSLCHVVVLLEFHLVLSSGTYSSAISFCLNFYLYFYVCGG